MKSTCLTSFALKFDRKFVASVAAGRLAIGAPASHVITRAR